MNQFYLGIGASAIAAVMIAATVAWFVHNDRERQALEKARDDISTIERTQDAISANPECDWLNRLRGTCDN